MNECTSFDILGDPIHTCGAVNNSQCEDTIGSFICVCADGYQMTLTNDGQQLCESKLMIIPSCFFHMINCIFYMYTPVLYK